MEKFLKKVGCISRNIISRYSDEIILELYDKIPHGKMMRSKLILSIHSSDNAIKLCAIIELIQLASLLHDDVIDESLTRRGSSSINALFGNKNSIMLGDMIYSSAFFELTNFDDLIAKSISKSVVKLSIGEINDVFLSQKFNNLESKYLNMICNKSANLIAASSYSAGVLKQQEENLKQYFLEEYFSFGLNLGMAFQIIDDILDITQTSSTLGKPALNDFVQGKMTLPYIYLYDSLSNEDKVWFRNLYDNEVLQNSLKEDSKNTILFLLKQNNSVVLAQNKAMEFASKALESAEKIGNVKLKNIITSAIQRKF